MGERFEADVGPIAHGGHCVVRLPEPEARVVFTRHALPGERVVVRITEGTDGDRFWRADAVEVLRASPDRVEAPCRYFAPGGCGGCDFQHVDVPAQRDLKAAVVREQLVRLGRLDPAHPLVAGLVVEPVPGDDDGLRWRTRQRWVRLPDGRRGLRKHRSHEVVAVDDCLIARPDAREPAAGSVRERVGEHTFTAAADGFWQVHPGAPEALVSAVLGLLEPAPGESVLDLYAGAGLFSRFLADRVGADGRVVAVEGDETAASHARANVPEAVGVASDVARALETAPETAGRFDLVVLDPPRSGAGRGVVEQVARRRPRAVAYVACDPAALARDIGYLADAGYRLDGLRAFDLFPMTHHVECVAVLVPA